LETKVEWVLFVIVASMGIALLLVRSPVGGSLGLFGFLLPFDTVLVLAQAGHLQIHITWIVGAAAGVILLLIAKLGNRLTTPPQAAVWLGLLIFWAVLSYFWALNAENAVFRLPVLALLLFLYFTASSIRPTEKEMATIIWLVIIGGFLGAAISLYGFYRGDWWTASLAGHTPRQLSGRETLAIGNRMTDPNILGASLILPLSLAVCTWLSSRTWPRRLLLFGFIGVIGASILATMSRGAIAAVATVFTVLIWRSGARRRVLLPLVIMGGIVMSIPDIPKRLMQSDRGAGRVDIWQVGLSAFRHYALFGAGQDCFPNAFNQYVQTAPNFVGFSRAPHNIYLGTGVELGLVGLVLLLGAIVRHLLLAVKGSHAIPDEALRLQLVSFQAALWGLLVCGFFLDILWDEYFWLTLMLMVMTVHSHKARWAPVNRDLVIGPRRYELTRLAG
jgi:O-antigen ligase